MKAYAGLWDVVQVGEGGIAGLQFAVDVLRHERVRPNRGPEEFQPAVFDDVQRGNSGEGKQEVWGEAGPKDTCLSWVEEELVGWSFCVEDFKSFGNFIDTADDGTVICIPAVHKNVTFV